MLLIQRNAPPTSDPTSVGSHAPSSCIGTRGMVNLLGCGSGGINHACRSSRVERRKNKKTTIATAADAATISSRGTKWLGWGHPVD